MTITHKQNRITFRVDPVIPAANLLPLIRTEAAVNELLMEQEQPLVSRIISCSGYNSWCVSEVYHHPLLSAVSLAFSQHRPLILSPDMIWITILQGLCHHIRNNSEKLRSRFVKHQGKLEISISRDDILEGSPENAWDSVIHQLSATVREQLLETYDKLICDFSTTGPDELTACEVALLDCFQPYFEYVIYTMCGIPEITLEGSSQDWTNLCRKLETLQDYELDFWLPHLRTIASHFKRASEGDVYLPHWQNIFKEADAYGWYMINGWIAKLIPYIRDVGGDYTLVNPLLLDGKKTAGYGQARARGVNMRDFPSGIGLAPFRIVKPDGESESMQFLGGFLGIEQAEHTMALRPKLGWAVRKAPEALQFLENLPESIKSVPLPADEFSECIAELECKRRYLRFIPGEFLGFYRTLDGFLCKAGKVLSLKELDFVDLQDVGNLQPEPQADYKRQTGREGQIDLEPQDYWQTPIQVVDSDELWLRFFEFVDGGFAAVQLVTKGPVWVVGNDGKKARIVGNFAEFISGLIKDSRQDQYC